MIPEALRTLGLLEPGEVAEHRWLQWIEPQVAKAPVAVASTYDFVWWIGYSCKYQTDTTHLFFNRAEVTPALLRSVKHFYASPEWAQWCYHHHNEMMTDKLVWASHKMPLKRFIHDFDGDDEYLNGKIKVKSAHNTWGYQLGIDSNLNAIHFGALSSSKLRMVQKYGASLTGCLGREFHFGGGPGETSRDC